MRTLAEMWASYDEDVIVPNEVPDALRTMSKRAFYSGASGLWDLLSQTGDGEAGGDRVDALGDELREFMQSVIAGRE